MSTEELLKALTALVESGDQETIDAALAILDPVPEEDAASAEDEPADKNAADPEEEKPTAEAAASVTADTAADLAAKLAEADEENKTLKAQLEASAKADYFTAQNVSPALQAVLSAKPLAEIKAIVSAMGVKPKAKAGLGTVKATVGKTAQPVDSAQRRMHIVTGVLPSEASVASTDYSQVFVRPAKRPATKGEGV